MEFARTEHLWQPVALPPAPTTVPTGSTRLTFEDREPADFIQVEVPSDGRSLRLVGTATDKITPPRQKRSPVTHPRFARIRLEFPRKWVFDYVLVPHDGGPIQAIAKGVEILPDRVVFESHYKQGTDTKLLNRIVLRDQRPCVNLHAMMERFDALFGVDTNTFRHREGDVWITAVCRGQVLRLDRDSAILKWTHLRTAITRPWAHSAVAEKHGWLLAIEALATRGEAPCSGLLGLVVDGHLPSLEAFSSRTMPLWGNQFLPPSWTLIYATSDAGTQECLPNAMLAGAHRNAKLVERRIRNKSFAELWPQAPSGHKDSPVGA